MRDERENAPSSVNVDRLAGDIHDAVWVDEDLQESDEMHDDDNVRPSPHVARP